MYRYNLWCAGRVISMSWAISPVKTTFIFRGYRTGGREGTKEKLTDCWKRRNGDSMTYEAFKKELLMSMEHQKGMEENRIFFLCKGDRSREKGMQEAILRANLSCWGSNSAFVLDDVLCVEWKENDCVKAGCFRVREYFECYKREGWTGILPKMNARLLEVQEGFRKSKNRLILRVVNCKRLVDDAIYWRIGEIALALYGIVGAAGREPITLRMNREMVKEWGLTDDVLLTTALFNSCDYMPLRIMEGTEACPRQTVSETGGLKQRLADNECGHCNGLRLTTELRMNGAVAFFYPGVMQELAEWLGEDYLVAFPNIHEVCIYPVGTVSAGRIRERIHMENILADEREVLTEKIYRYCRNGGRLIEV